MGRCFCPIDIVWKLFHSRKKIGFQLQRLALENRNIVIIYYWWYWWITSNYHKSILYSIVTLRRTKCGRNGKNRDGCIWQKINSNNPSSESRSNDFNWQIQIDSIQLMMRWRSIAYLDLCWKKHKPPLLTHIPSKITNLQVLYLKWFLKSTIANHASQS